MMRAVSRSEVGAGREGLGANERRTCPFMGPEICSHWIETMILRGHYGAEYLAYKAKMRTKVWRSGHSSSLSLVSRSEAMVTNVDLLFHLTSGWLKMCLFQ